MIVFNKDEIWSADLVDMQAFSSFNKGFKYIRTVIDVFIKYAWAVPIKDNIKSEMRSFKSNENIHKKEGGSYYVVSANKASSVTL